MQKMKIIFILHPEQFKPSWTGKVDWERHTASVITNTTVFTDTGHHQLRISGLLCFARGLPMNQLSILYYFTCSLYMYIYKKHTVFVVL